MKKIALFMMAALLLGQSLMAQLADGIKNLSYEKYNTAKDFLKKAYDANPKDPQTIYWYGQSLVASDLAPTKDAIKAAKDVYQKAMQELGSDAWLLVGMGHMEILEGGDINAAKQKFEQAITATTETKGKNKGKPNPSILNAIGRANADGDSKQGDPAYAIDKLKQAGAIDLTNPDIFINMGINYQKMGGEYGGEAVKAYTEAIARDPKNARAKYRIGRIYLSQNNKELFEQFFNDAIAADPTFPPVYYALYNYYSDKDINKAKEYLDKYVAAADKDPQNDLFLADYLFRAGRYSESIAKAKEIEASAGATPIPALQLVYAYNYDRSGDSVQAKASIEKYFATIPQAKIKPADYELAVKILSKFPGSEDAAVGYIEKAMVNDTSTENRLNYTKLAAGLYAKANNVKSQLVWLKKNAALKKEMGNTDYYYLVDATVKAGELDEAARLSAEYIQKFPDQIYGYRFASQVAMAQDADSTKGTAVPFVEQYITFLSKDAAKNANLIKRQYYYIAVLYADKVKDYAKALETVDKILAIDPEDSFAKPAKEQLTKALSKPPVPAKPGPKSGTTSGTSSNAKANGTEK